MGRTVRAAWLTRGLGMTIALAILFSTFALALAPRSASANEFFAPDSEQLYFDSTGQVLGGVFLEAWRDLGGIDRTGYPISPAIHEGDRWVQWFEFARMEVPNGETVVENVTFAPAGRLYAESTGYTRWHPAFKPVESAGEGAMFFEETGHSLANAMLTAWTNTYDEVLGMPISEEFSVGETIYQFFENGALSWTMENGTMPVPIGILDATVRGQLAPPSERPEAASDWNPTQFSRASTGSGERWIEINLANYTLTAWEGDVAVMSSLVVVGAWAAPTVQGEFSIYWKLESQTMEGLGWDGTPYRQEDVPHVMYFFEDYAIHGAYWRSSFGYGASQGCVNLPLDMGEWLYYWADYGTRVVVHSG